VKHNTLIFLSGTTWLVIGVFLLSLGLNFILSTMRAPPLFQEENRFSLILFLLPIATSYGKAVVLLITLSLLLGYVKGKMMLSTSVNRQIARINSLPNPTSIFRLYGRGYYILIALMIGMGISIRFLPITLDTRGAIDIVIGSALINGSMLYFRRCLSPGMIPKIFNKS
jgi:hypothetical protein